MIVERACIATKSSTITVDSSRETAKIRIFTTEATVAATTADTTANTASEARASFYAAELVAVGSCLLPL